MKKYILFFVVVFFSLKSLIATPAQIGKATPDFQLKTQAGKSFSIKDRKGTGWTVLFFYPKAGTPGCTKQACAFRDSIKKIRELGAEVYGISADSVEEQLKFHKEHKLVYDLLSDSKMDVINQFGAKMEDKDLAKRWTFILDPQLVIRSIDDKVDPVMDPAHVATKLKELQKY